MDEPCRMHGGQTFADLNRDVQQLVRGIGRRNGLAVDEPYDKVGGADVVEPADVRVKLTPQRRVLPAQNGR